MKSQSGFGIVLVAVLLAAGCSSVGSRIAKHRDEFSAWPAVVQDKVVVGQIDVGFTPEQVRVALGEPDSISTRTTADGTSEVWGFRDPQPRFAFGIGFGLGRGSTAMGAGVRVGEDGFRHDEKLRVVFDRTGQVAVIEEAKRR